MTCKRFWKLDLVGKELMMDELTKPNEAATKGLSSQEAAQRLQQYGSNAIWFQCPERREGFFYQDVAWFFLGTHSLDDRNSCHSFRCRPALV
ncbi:MAG: hypothetical protein GWP07_08035 [Xanthomonadaceae bacterium]|nr:hypothetical protein [Xanthomonadaceae bacterium]